MAIFDYMSEKKKKDKQSVKYTVIEVDENTAEPKLVELSQEEYDARVNKGMLPKNNIEITPENEEKVGKQIMMNKVFGTNEKVSPDDTEAVSRRQKVFKHISTILFVSLVVAVLMWTAYNDFFAKGKTLPTGEYLASVLSSRWFYIIFAVLALLLCYLLKATKHSLMSINLKGKANFKTCLSTATLGLYYNYVTPLAVGGQPFEIYNLTQNGFSGGEATSMTLSSFILHQIAFVLCGVISLSLFVGNTLQIPEQMYTAVPKVISIIAVVGLILAFSVPVFAIVFSLNSKLGEKIVSFVFFLGGKLKIVRNPQESKAKTLKNLAINANCLKTLATKPLLFITEFLMSFCEHLSLCSIAYFTLKFFGFNWDANGVLEWLQVVQLCFILYAAISFIPTPGNSGAADLSFYLLFDTGLGIVANGGTAYSGLAFPAMIIWRLLSFYSFIIIGFFYNLIRKKKKKKALQEGKPV